MRFDRDGGKVSESSHPTQVRRGVECRLNTGRVQKATIDFRKSRHDERADHFLSGCPIRKPRNDLGWPPGNAVSRSRREWFLRCQRPAGYSILMPACWLLLVPKNAIRSRERDTSDQADNSLSKVLGCCVVAKQQFRAMVLLPEQLRSSKL